MPFIEESKYQLMQQDMDDTKLKLEAAEREITEFEEQFAHQKQKSRTFIILLGIFFGLACGIIFLMLNGTIGTTGKSEAKEINITAIKAKEEQRVIDSLRRLELSKKAKTVDNNSLTATNIDSQSDKVSSKTNGKTIYSVQIGVFSKSKNPMISSDLTAGIIAPADGYFKYSVGLFTTLKEAKNMRRELVKIGFDDAFVASYINGKRQKIHH